MPFIGIITLVSQTKKNKKQHPNHSPFFSELAREFNMTVEKVVEAKDELQRTGVEMGSTPMDGLYGCNQS